MGKKIFDEKGNKRANLEFHEGLARDYDEKGWFHIKEKNFKPAYPERYDWVCDFSEGLAAVCKGKKYFHIRKKDFKPAYKNRFEFATKFRKGIAKVRIGKEFFSINFNGEIITSG
ncbi:MAG: hypothetical protein Athens101410_142 [Parcubacteria group bacterium Athens1014_10]|nr:MAG: hypothetical protein Athens101410_142 [Parcubacteria group bacterium Athens1014_10]TSD05889.1 MAG: hypothetical protein Athens071412_171 [Parcubacteria group bacterium Athens0714_12]